MSSKIKLAIILVTGMMFGLVQTSQAEEEISELEEVVITGTKTEHLLKDVPVETILITGEEIERTNATNVIDVLKWLPGVKSVGRYQAMGRDVYSIGGLSSDYTLILIDGQRIEGSHVLTELPVNMIERIEIVKGPNSVLYGSDALNGVINIITKTPPEKTSANTTFAFGSYGSQIIKAGLGSMVGKLKFDISTNANTIKGETETSQVDNYNVLGKFKYDFSERVGLKFGSGFYNVETKYTESKKTNFNLGLDWKIDDRSALKASSYMWNYDDEAYVGGGPTATETDTEFIQGEIQYSYLFGERNLVTAGAETLKEEMESTDFAQEKQTTNSFFVQDEINVLEPLTLVPAVRLDSHSEWGKKTNPKISMLWKISEMTNFRTSWGQAFKSPEFKNMYRTTYHPVGPTGFWIKGNPDLKPETSSGYRAGIEHRFTKNFLSSIAFFRNDIEDMIKGYWVKKFKFPPPRPVKGEYSYHNIDKVFTQGAEVSLKAHLIDTIMTTLAYTYMDTENKETGKKLTDAPEHRVNLGLRYYDKRIGLMTELRGEYEGEVYTNKDNTKKADDYLIAHLKISQTIAKDIKVFLNVENVFDKESEQAGEGRIFTGGVTAKF